MKLLTALRASKLGVGRAAGCAAPAPAPAPVVYAITVVPDFAGAGAEALQAQIVGAINQQNPGSLAGFGQQCAVYGQTADQKAGSQHGHKEIHE